MMTPSSFKRLVLSLIALASLGAQEPRPTARFAGKSIPDPPRQKEPWTPPQTKLPLFLVSATSAMFEHGMADPRGCEYREVAIVEGRTIKTQAFVLPQKPDEPGRFAVGWDGVIRPASSVGPAADLDADIRNLAEAMLGVQANAAGQRAGRPGRAARFLDPSRFGSRFDLGEYSNTGDRSALKLCLLLRLGRADLAETLFAAATTWTPEIRGRDLTDYHINYLTLAREWASRMFLRLVGAHRRGDDAIARDAARRLSAFTKAAEVTAMKMGFAQDSVRLGHDRPTYFTFLGQLPELLADQERRAREAPRGPVPPLGADPAARVAALIRELDQIVGRLGPNGSGDPDSSPLVAELVTLGDAAVEPLLAAIENDTRLTRTVTHEMAIDCRVHPVLEPEFAALTAILNTQQFSGRQYQVQSGALSRKDLARTIRDFWMKNRALSLNERWYRTLRDDSSGYARWLEAAASIVQPADQVGPAAQGAFVRALETSTAPMKGEELRSRRDPSISDLLARRTLEIAHAPRPQTTPNVELQNACGLAILLHRWDPKAALPVIRTLMTEARESVDRDRSGGYGQFDRLVEYVARFTLIRARAGEPAALTEYAAEIRKWDPEKDHPHRFDVFEPIWSYPDDPAIREATRWLFNDPGSPWAALLRKPGSSRLPFFFTTSLYVSPLLRSAGFRQAVLDAMAIRTEVGTVRRGRQTRVQYEITGGVQGSFPATEADLERVPLGVDQKIRACDYIAWEISSIEGAPRCELYWTNEMRDAAVEACAAFLKTHGDRFTADPPPGERALPFEKKAHLAFPVLDRPATKEDVRAGRAIFSLEGEGEVRRIDLPSIPIKAKWTPPEGAPGGGAMDGWVWQAEEVRSGDQWERYYGFVGRHVIARVPGGSIELAGRQRTAPGDR
jgi:hypothetical protein